MGLKMSFFCHFPKFGLLVFPKIDYSDGLQQRLTTSRGETGKNNFGSPNLAQTDQIGA